MLLKDTREFLHRNMLGLVSKYTGDHCAKIYFANTISRSQFVKHCDFSLYAFFMISK